MCIQAIGNLLQGNICGAVSAEANAWGLGGASANASACATKGAGGGIHACTSRSGNSHSMEFGSASRHGAYAAGHGRDGARFEKTTTQTRVGADGSVTQKTTHFSSSEPGRGCGGHGEYGRRENHGSGYGRSYDSSCVRHYDHMDQNAAWRSRGGVLAQSGALAGGGSFAAASVSIMPTGLLNLLGGLFGGARQQTA